MAIRLLEELIRKGLVCLFCNIDLDRIFCNIDQKLNYTSDFCNINQKVTWICHLKLSVVLS